MTSISQNIGRLYSVIVQWQIKNFNNRNNQLSKATWLNLNKWILLKKKKLTFEFLIFYIR